MIGSGILNQPEVFLRSGVIGALGLYAVTATFIYFSLILLVETAIYHDELDYAELSRKILGSAGHFTVCFFVALADIGALLSYITVIGGTTSGKLMALVSYIYFNFPPYPELVQKWGCTSNVCDVYSVTSIMVVVCILPLAIRRYYGFLGFLSVASIFAIGSVLLFVMIGGPLAAIHREFPVAATLVLFNIKGLVTKSGSIVFSLACTIIRSFP